ncbi:hypothetical protein [Dickeya oryzae]
MNTIWMFLIALLMNIPSLAPVLFLRKIPKKVKASLALRLFLLNAFLVLSVVTLSQNTTQKIWAVPVMADVSCYWAVYGHTGANDKIYT